METEVQTKDYAETKERVQSAILALNEEISRAVNDGLQVFIRTNEHPSGKYYQISANYSISV